MFSIDQIVVVTVGFAPAELTCLRPYVSVFVQENGPMLSANSETADKSDQYVAIAALSGALSWTHEREAESQTVAPRTVVCPMEATEFMDLVKSGRQHMRPPDHEQI
jgi:hypothetical protein